MHACSTLCSPLLDFMAPEEQDWIDETTLEQEKEKSTKSLCNLTSFAKPVGTGDEVDL